MKWVPMTTKMTMVMSCKARLRSVAWGVWAIPPPLLRCDMNKFYLVRSPNCYHGRKSTAEELHGKFETAEEAKRVATEFATQTQRTQLVYEVRLIGRAAVAEAVWVGATNENLG